MGCDNGSAPQAWLIHQGRSLHLQHGPIDLIATASGTRESILCAYRQAHEAFRDVLAALVRELPELRTPVTELSSPHNQPTGLVAKVMVAVCLPYQDQYVTPMAAVAGAVADHVLHRSTDGNPVDKMLINNGGDIAIHMNKDQTCRVGICGQLESAEYADVISLRASDGIGGVATSGWKGRSMSLGIADAVTVLASTAAMADVAATLIANEVNLPDSNKVQRVAANELRAETDLGEQPVTVAVDALNALEIDSAIQHGIHYAQNLLKRGLIRCAYIHVQGTTEIVSDAVVKTIIPDANHIRSIVQA